MGKKNHKGNRSEIRMVDNEATSEGTNSLVELFKKQNSLWEQIETYRKNYKKTSKEARKKGYIQGRIFGINECWRQFSNNHCVIESISSAIEKGHKYFVENMFSKVDEFYSNFLGELNDDLEPFLAATTLNSPTQYTSQLNSTLAPATRAEIKMPRIEIPKFSGSYKTWRAFKDLFVSTIHNSSIAKVQKMYFLKSNLEGEAAKLIRHLEATEENYDAAWSILTQRFENKRIIVNHQLQHLMAQPAAKTESHEAVRQIIDTTNESLHALKGLGINTTSWDSMLIYTLVQKIPAETRDLWETSLGSSTELPTLSTFLTFLEGRFRALEMMKSHHKTQSSNDNREKFQHIKRERKTFHLQPNHSCVLCNNSHSLRRCAKFLNMNSKFRTEYVMKKGLCRNCLANSHTTQGCPSPGSCFYCGQRHHSLLHNSMASEGNSVKYSAATPYTSNGLSRYQKGSPQHGMRSNTPHHVTTQNLRTNVNTSESIPTADNTAHSSSPHRLANIANHQDITTLHLKNKTAHELLLATALISVPTPAGDCILRAVIDPRSQGSFITEKAAQRLKLRKTRIHAEINGMNFAPVSTSKSLVSFNIHSTQTNDLVRNVTAYVVPNITTLLPTQPFTLSKACPHLQNLTLADPHFSTPSMVDVLLGVEVYGSILLPGLRIGAGCCPTALNTQLGWILFGEIPIKIDSPKNPESLFTQLDTTPSPQTNFIVSLHCNIDTEKLLRDFWELEEILETRPFNEDELACEELYASTHQRGEDGRYIVHLPFKNLELPILGRSREMAVQRLHAMERKLGKNPRLNAEYAKCLQKYIKLGHMKPSPTTEIEHRVTDQNGTVGYMVNYLPHHAVVKESTTTPLRVVFDASARTTNGYTLNDTLLTGPKLQEDLIDIILRWRKYSIAFTADITKMYRQIKVTDQHIQYQRILWRSNSDEKVQEYDLSTVTFGTACAPYLAMRTIKQLAHDEKERYPLAYIVANRDFYVDDVMSGDYEIENGLKIQRQLIEMLGSGGFQLRKWASNTSALINHLPEELKESIYPLSFDTEHCITTLGICWYPIQDAFALKITQSHITTTLSKRSLLSQIASLFDPIGWVAPCIIIAKMLIQKLWLIGVGWDDHLPAGIEKEWNTLRSELQLLKAVRIPRWIGTINSTAVIQLHGFCDASTKAYCAVIYSRVVSKSGKAQVSLLTSKTKVAPVKPITLPRLELCAAVLLSKLMYKTQNALNPGNFDVYTWTDSMITLSWIHEKPTKWRTFVCNRVAAIQARTSINRWHHVSSVDNPADCGSRGLLPSKLLDNPLWWSGPHWLKLPKEAWPLTANHHITDIEAKTIQTFTTQPSSHYELITKYSKLTTLLRIVAWCLRFINNCKSFKSHRQNSWLTAKEIYQARICCTKVVQQESYGHDIASLQNYHNVPVKSRLLSLNPFLSVDGLLRVGGLLGNSNLKYDEKHPCILPNQHYFTELVVSDAHHKTLHGGPQLMLAYLRKTVKT